MGRLLWPNGSTTIPRVTSEFGPRTSIPTPGGATSSYHRGIDIVGFSTVLSPVDGVARFVAYNGGFGNLVIVREHDTGDDFYLAHNARFLVGQGAHVSAGDPVAIMGTTGASTGVHTHEEVHPNGGAAVNPRTYYAARQGASTAGGGSSPFNPPENGSEMYIISSPNRPATLVGPGYVCTLTAEEATNIGAIVSKSTVVNDRQFDLAISAAQRGEVSAPKVGPYLIESPNRPLALADVGFFRVLNSEEEEQYAGYFTPMRRLSVNDRQYDLARSIATS